MRAAVAIPGAYGRFPGLVLSAWMCPRRRLDKLDSLYRRDKGPPKKGQGKRASKKK